MFGLRICFHIISKYIHVYSWSSVLVRKLFIQLNKILALISNNNRSFLKFSHLFTFSYVTFYPSLIHSVRIFLDLFHSIHFNSIPSVFILFYQALLISSISILFHSTLFHYMKSNYNSFHPARFISNLLYSILSNSNLFHPALFHFFQQYSIISNSIQLYPSLSHSVQIVLIPSNSIPFHLSLFFSIQLYFTFFVI